MKNLIILVLFMWISTNHIVFAQSSPTDIVKKARKISIDRYVLKHQNSFAVQMDYGKAVVVKDAEKIKFDEIKRIELMYSGYPKNSNFSTLNANRIKELYQIIPNLSKFPNIEWVLIEQTACKTEAEARQLFHGFVLHYSLFDYENNDQFVPFTPEQLAENRKFGVRPPIKNLQIPFIQKQIDAQKGGVLVSDKGSAVVIPPDAFLDEKGNLIQGKVEVRYREFSGSGEIYLAGIPMEIDEKRSLESAGMFEFRAYSAGKAVFPNPKQAINVSLVTAQHQKQDGYAQFYLDSAQGKWIEVGAEKIATYFEVETSNPDFNEMQAWKGITWECLTDTMQTENFVRLFMEKAGEVEILKQEKGDFLMTFSYFTIKITGIDYTAGGAISQKKELLYRYALPVRPVNLIGEDMEAKYLYYQSMRKKRLGIQQKQEEIAAQKKAEEERIRAEKERRKAEAAKKAAMEEERKAEILRYRQSRLNMQNAISQFSLNSFGVWNCDRYFNTPMDYEYYFMLSDNNQNVASDCKLINLDERSVSHQYFNVPIKASKDGRYVILVADRKDKLFYCPEKTVAEVFKKGVKKGEKGIVFPLLRVETTGRTIQDFMANLGISLSDETPRTQIRQDTSVIPAEVSGNNNVAPISEDFEEITSTDTANPYQSNAEEALKNIVKRVRLERVK